MDNLLAKFCFFNIAELMKNHNLIGFIYLVVNDEKVMHVKIQLTDCFKI